MSRRIQSPSVDRQCNDGPSVFEIYRDNNVAADSCSCIILERIIATSKYYCNLSTKPTSATTSTKKTNMISFLLGASLCVAMSTDFPQWMKDAVQEHQYQTPETSPKNPPQEGVGTPRTGSMTPETGSRSSPWPVATDDSRLQARHAAGNELRPLLPVDECDRSVVVGGSKCRVQ